MSYPISHVARAIGRTATFMIVPARDYTAVRPDCDLCTWVASGYGRFYLKYCNSACVTHARLPRVGTS